MNEAVERLEIKMAYLERANAELSDELYGSASCSMPARTSCRSAAATRGEHGRPMSADLLSEKRPTTSAAPD